MDKRVNSFKDLIVWKKSHELTIMVYMLSKNFPSDEKFGIISQMRRAAYSIPSNIVEGHSRRSKKEFLRFLSIAKGSLEELKYFSILSKDLKYLNEREFKILENLSDEVSKILFGFTRSLKSTDR